MERLDGKIPLKLLCAAPLLALVAAAQTATFRIAPTPGSTFALKVYKSGLMSGKVHDFVFERYSGELRFDSSKAANSSIELTIETGSLVLKDDWLNEKDFKNVEAEARGNMLAVDKFSEMKFVSKQIREKAPGQYEVDGTLAIRDQTQPATIQVKLIREGETLRFEGSAVVKLKDYGLKPPSAALGLVGTKNEMDVNFNLQAKPSNQ